MRHRCPPQYPPNRAFIDPLIGAGHSCAMNLTGPDFSQAAYWTEFDERGERLVMPMRRSWKAVGMALLGFGFWLGERLIHFKHNLDALDWLDYATIGFISFVLLHLLLNVLTSLIAREVLRVDGRDLVHGWTMLGLKRETRYRLEEILGLESNAATLAEEAKELISPFRDFGKKGVVKFDYRGNACGIGAALDEAHGQQVVNWIARRIPRIPAGF